MDRRGALMGVIRTAFGIAAAKNEAIKPIASKLISSVPVPATDPYDYGSKWDDRGPEGAAATILETLYDSSCSRRGQEDFDHSIRALKSCSPVYKASLQADRNSKRQIETVLRSYNGSVPDLMAALTKKLTSLS